jgi:hypothetical protein
VRDDGRVVRRTLAALTGVLALAATATGCGTASPPSPPAGVDELVVPTPSVDPGDFVDTITNPWLPYAPGASWSYRVTGAEAAGTLTVAVRREREQVDGVAATVVDRTAPDGTLTTDLFAQDRRGNVWWLGREGEWQAGQDGAEAGLAMPATPRYGDGWREAYAVGVAEDRATVTSLEGRASTPAGAYDDMVVLTTTNGDEELRASYAKGVGLVLEVAAEGSPYAAALQHAPTLG